MDNQDRKGPEIPQPSEKAEPKELSESELKQVTGGAIETSAGIVQKAIKKID